MYSATSSSISMYFKNRFYTDTLSDDTSKIQKLEGKRLEATVPLPLPYKVKVAIIMQKRTLNFLALYVVFLCIIQ